MQIQIEHKNLSNALSFTGKILKSKNTIPAFGMFALATTENTLHVRVVTDEMGVYTQCSAKCNAGIKMAVMGSDFLKLIKSLYGTLTLTVDKKLNVKTSTGKYSLALENYDDMPTQDIKNAESLFSIDANELSAILNIAASHVSQDDLRPIMQVIHINTAKKEVVATDASELIIQHAPITDVVREQDINISTATQRAISGLQDNITIKKANNLLVFDNGKNKIVQRTIEGQYPNYSAVIPQDNSIKVIVARDALINALKRLRNVSNSASWLVVLDIKDSLIKMRSEDIDFSKAGEETIPATVEGGDIKIGFNIDKLINLLKSRYSDKLILEFSKPSRAMVCSGDDNITSILMPLMLDE